MSADRRVLDPGRQVCAELLGKRDRPRWDGGICRHAAHPA
jgi:hypothetical protein